MTIFTRNKLINCKLDLSGCDNWTEEQQQMFRDCIIKHNHIFAVDYLELENTDLVKHVIKLDNYVPLKEWNRRIAPQQYKEVRKHLNEMLEIGAIRNSNSPWIFEVLHRSQKIECENSKRCLQFAPH